MELLAEDLKKAEGLQSQVLSLVSHLFHYSVVDSDNEVWVYLAVLEQGPPDLVLVVVGELALEGLCDCDERFSGSFSHVVVFV